MGKLAEDAYRERFLYDLANSKSRIRLEGKEYGIKNITDLMLEPQDFENAQKMYSLEAAIVRDREGNLTENGVFQGAIYCILAANQLYGMQKEAFDALMAAGLDTPKHILTNKGEFRKIVKGNASNKGVNFSTQKADRILDLAGEWENLDIYPQILAAAGQGMDEEIHIRDKLAENAAGFREKTASLLLRMCGAKYLVPIDTIMQEMLYFHGYPIEIARKTIVRKDEGNRQKLRKKEITKKEYPAYVRYTEDLAGKYGVLCHEIQLAYWVTKSSYCKLK